MSMPDLQIGRLTFGERLDHQDYRRLDTTFSARIERGGARTIVDHLTVIFGL